MKYLLVKLKIQDGLHEYTFSKVHQTKGKNLNWSAEKFAATYLEGYSKHRQFGGWWTHSQSRAAQCVSWTKITKRQYNFLQDKL